eukprot:11821828-Ditylum_brightwellii.AAC.1
MMIIIVRRSDKPSTVQRKEVNDSVKQLGVIANPAGDFSQELERRNDYSARMATRIRTMRMKLKNAFCLYRNIWLPAYQYPLAVRSFTEGECLSIMKPFVCAILPKLGFKRHSPQEIIYGAEKYGGFNMTHLYLEQ